MIQFLLAVAMLVLSLFLLLLILLQKGRGGGLAGALGGVGGSSPFGAKAGDTFTKVTVVVAFIWILTCGFSCFWFSNLSKKSVVDDAAFKKPEAAAPANTEAAPADPQALPETLDGTAAEQAPALPADLNAAPAPAAETPAAPVEAAPAPAAETPAAPVQG